MRAASPLVGFCTAACASSATPTASIASARPTVARWAASRGRRQPPELHAVGDADASGRSGVGGAQPRAGAEGRDETWPDARSGCCAAAARCGRIPDSRGFASLARSGTPATITIGLQLAGGSGLRRQRSFNAAAEEALIDLEPTLSRIRVTRRRRASACEAGDNDSRQPGVFRLHLLRQRSVPTRGCHHHACDPDTERVEADVVFNTAINWDSYRGNVR